MVQSVESHSSNDRQYDLVSWSANVYQSNLAFQSQRGIILLQRSEEHLKENVRHFLSFLWKLWSQKNRLHPRTGNQQKKHNTKTRKHIHVWAVKPLTRKIVFYTNTSLCLGENSFKSWKEIGKRCLKIQSLGHEVAIAVTSLKLTTKVCDSSHFTRSTLKGFAEQFFFCVALLELNG